jgi:hypothetical protein
MSKKNGNGDDDHPEFDWEKSRDEAEEGMARADASRRIDNVLWKLRAAEYRIHHRSEEMTADKLSRAIGLPVGRAVVGAWFNGQAKQRKLVFTGKWCQSSRVTRHVGAQRVWWIPAEDPLDDSD